MSCPAPDFKNPFGLGRFVHSLTIGLPGTSARWRSSRSNIAAPTSPDCSTRTWMSRRATGYLGSRLCRRPRAGCKPPLAIRLGLSSGRHAQSVGPEHYRPVAPASFSRLATPVRASSLLSQRRGSRAVTWGIVIILQGNPQYALRNVPITTGGTREVAGVDRG